MGREEENEYSLRVREREREREGDVVGRISKEKIEYSGGKKSEETPKFTYPYEEYSSTIIFWL